MHKVDEKRQSLAQTYDFIENPIEPETWRNAEAVYTEEHLYIQGQDVMAAWEHPYMSALARIATSNGGVVLEGGFGMGISASYIQSYPIEKHIVVEANVNVFEKLKAFAQTSEKPVEPLSGLWQDVIASIPDASIDGILFDICPINEVETVITFAVPFFKEAHRILKKGGIFTYFSCEVEDYSDEHLKLLKEAGFESIDKEIIPISPPQDCEYWGSSTMIAPIIRK